jgi:hypothetical protein
LWSALEKSRTSAGDFRWQSSGKCGVIITRKDTASHKEKAWWIVVHDRNLERIGQRHLYLLLQHTTHGSSGSFLACDVAPHSPSTLQAATRLIINLFVSGSTIFGKAFVDAWRQASISTQSLLFRHLCHPTNLI